MRILFASSEVMPYSKTSGLADISSALPEALAARGHEVTIITPRYSNIDVATWDLRRKRFRLTITIRGKSIHGGLLEGKTPSGVDILFVDQPSYYERGGLYAENGSDYTDNDERFAYYCHSVLESCRLMGMSPDVIHLNDWQTGPIAPLLQNVYRDRPELNQTGTVFTIHGLTAQGLFAPQAMMTLGLDWSFFTPSTLEFHGKLSFLKAGLVFADKLTTISPSYAKEIQTPGSGIGLEGLLQERNSDLKGILNGVDYRLWDPMTDKHITANYSKEQLAGKKECKTDLQKRLGLPQNSELPLIACISRLTTQKGIDLFLESAQELLTLDCQYAFLGEGEPQIEQSLWDIADRSPHRLSFHKEYDEELAHCVVAGSDMCLVPSRYEPGGLTQIYALRYGTIPIVRAVGGLNDTVDDASDEEGCGFKFEQATPQQLKSTIERAISMYNEPDRWQQLIENAMFLNFSWDLPARRYEALYREVSGFRK